MEVHEKVIENSSPNNKSIAKKDPGIYNMNIDSQNSYLPNSDHNFELENPLPKNKLKFNITKSERLDISEAVKTINKKAKKKIYTTVPTKLPPKAEMVAEYKALCAEKNIKPGTDSSINKKYTKTLLYKRIQEIKEKGKKDGVDVDKTYAVPDSLKKSAASFLYDMSLIGGATMENYFYNRPHLNVDIDGFTMNMMKKHKEQKADLYRIVEKYPQLATYLDPVLIYAVKQGNNFVQTNSLNKKKADPQRLEKKKGSVNKSSRNKARSRSSGKNNTIRSKNKKSYMLGEVGQALPTGK